MDDPRYLRLPEPEKQPEEGSATVDLGELDMVKTKPDAIVIDLPDGAVTINFGGLGLPNLDAKDHDANLAEVVDNGTLNGIADDLLRLITDDITRQEQRLQDVVKGIELLGVKLEEARTEPGDEGMSVVRHPLLLESVLRFQANARGELLPADGPVKVANDGDATQPLDEQANQLETDFNHYLTVGAPEYYPDTDRMFFSLGHSGEAYRKVYYHPLKRRPVVETIDRKDMILSDGAVSLEACGRITHRTRMRASIVKQMQLAGVWRDTSLSAGNVVPDINIVDRKLDDIAGIMPKLSMGAMEEADREIYECYCELDLKGFEHKEDGEETGLPLPYRVTMDKESRQILEIRRWWEEGDTSHVRKEVFVEYVFVPAFPGVNLGLLHILGNATRALTAAWRIALDNGMLANFPGGIMARSTGKQQTTTIRVGPGQVAPLDVDGTPLQQAFMPLPYRDVSAGFLQIIQNVEATSQRVGGTAETAVGEGRGDAPVGTTIAMIEQSQKVLNAVHKRMHQAQQKEFMLLRDLFRRDPEALWRNNKNPGFQKDQQELLAALDNNDIVPKADPNTASQTLRIQKAIAIYTLASQNPAAFDQMAVYNRIFGMLGIDDANTLYNKNPPAPPQPDPNEQMKAQASMLTANAKLMDAQVKAQTAQAEHGIKLEGIKAKNIDAITKHQSAQSNAQLGALEQANKLQLEQMKLQQSTIVHKEKLRDTDVQKKSDRRNAALLKGLDLLNSQQEHDRTVAAERERQSNDFAHQRATKERDIAHQRESQSQNLAHQRATKDQDIAHQRESNMMSQEHARSLEDSKAENARRAQFEQSMMQPPKGPVE